MKKFIAFVVVLCAVMISTTASAARGVVAFYNERSNKIVIETDNGFTCGEVTGIIVHLSRGDEVAGDLESSGSHEIYNITEDESFSMWIDDYWLSKERALDWLEQNY